MVNTRRLAGAIRGKRGKMPLRKAAEGAGIAYNTLCKLENEEVREPDLSTLVKLCEWLGVQIDYFITKEQAEAA